MSNACRLPSIRLLSLDLPLPGHQDPHILNPDIGGGNQHVLFTTVHPSYGPLNYAPGGLLSYATIPHGTGLGSTLGNPGAIPSLGITLSQGLVSKYNHEYNHMEIRLQDLQHPNPIPQSASSAYSFLTNAPSRLPSSVASFTGGTQFENELEHSSSLIASGAPVSAHTPVQPANEKTEHSSELETLEANSSSLLPKSPKDGSWKPRRKRQCPECHLYFSNLVTHKSTHLKPTSRPHLCKLCHRGFARPNDLFRHFKCHWKEIGVDKGQFRCPFKNKSLNSQEDHCCHTLGIFSRCDTYKNHLKAIHFQYPSGTKKSQRNNVSGSCRLCKKQFATVDDWIQNHIDAHECPFATH